VQSTEPEVFDVFLCHNTKDKPAVREVARELVRKGIKPWLDIEQIRPGTTWQKALRQQISHIKSAAVFIGNDGIGPWQDEEIQGFLSEFVDRECPVIPTILASAITTPNFPWPLRNRHHVDFRSADPNPLEQLIWGITGEKSAAKAPLVSGQAELPISSAKSLASRLYLPLENLPDRDQTNQLEILRRRVKQDWVDGVLKQSLFKDALIYLGKTDAKELIDAPWTRTVEFANDSKRNADLSKSDETIYDEAGLLLILGEPGSGKTTKLLALAEQLLNRAATDIRERVAIVLNLSSWKKSQTLSEWIVEELSRKYRVPKKIGIGWLNNKYLLLLLDGLDEVETSRRPNCVAAINAFVIDSNPPGLVVCCRLGEYQWLLPDRLKLNAAICLKPLNREDINRYLDDAGAKLLELRQAVDSDPVLQELAQTPLMLSIMSLAFQEASRDQLTRQLGQPFEERRKQIFKLYVAQMFRRKSATSVVFPPEKATGWLSWLAANMRQHTESIFLIEELQPSASSKGGIPVAYGTVAALIFGIFVTITISLWIYCEFTEFQQWDRLGLLFFIVTFGIGLGCWDESAFRNGLFCGLIFLVSICGLIFLVNIGMALPHIIAIAALLALLLYICGLGLVKLPRTIHWLVKALPFAFLVMLHWEIPGLLDHDYATSTIVAFLSLTGALIGGLGVGSLKYVTLLEPISWRSLKFWRATILNFWETITYFMSELTSLRPFEMAAQEVEPSPLPSIDFSQITRIEPGRLKNGAEVGATSSNNAIRRLLIRSFVVFLMTLIFGSIGNPIIGALGLFFGLILGLNQGGSAVIKHYSLRLVLWLKGYTPLNLVKFLNHCTKLIFLKRVGGGYIFIHRMLLDYFADLYEERESERTSGKKSSVSASRP
jgi:eukaryotic-like serine/threonine-protein kinase